MNATIITACWAASSSSLSSPDEESHNQNVKYIGKPEYNLFIYLIDYLQKIPQTHKPTTQNKSLRCWEGPVSCRSPTPAVILLSNLWGEIDTNFSHPKRPAQEMPECIGSLEIADPSPPHVDTWSFRHRMKAKRKPQMYIWDSMLAAADPL